MIFPKEMKKCTRKKLEKVHGSFLNCPDCDQFLNFLDPDTSIVSGSGSSNFKTNNYPKSFDPDILYGPGSRRAKKLPIHNTTRFASIRIHMKGNAVWFG